MPDRLYTFELNDAFNNALADITYITSDKSGTYRLSRPSIWTGKVPCDRSEVNTVAYDGYANLSKGRRLKVRLDGQIVHNGIVMKVERTGDENQAFATFTSVDPMIWWASRMAQDVGGNFSNPDFGTQISGPDIIRAAVVNTTTNDGPMGMDVIYGDYDTFGSPGTPDLELILGDWPKTVSDLATQLVNTGFMDIVLNPVDVNEGQEPGIMARLNAYTLAGIDHSSISFDYGMGNNSIGAVRSVDSIETLCNKLYMYFGPRHDPEHWQGLITLTDPMTSTQPSQIIQRRNALVSIVADSRRRYGVWMEAQIHEQQQKMRVRAMYEVLWLTEQYLRVNGRELVFFTPTASASNKPFTDYNLGDTVRLNVNAQKFGVGYSNVSTRIYGFDVSPDLEGVERMGEMITSADAE